MVFSSMTFLWVFLPLLLITYFLTKDRFKNYILLCFSLVFYAWGEPKYIFLMIASVVVNYSFGRLIDKLPDGGRRRFTLICSIIFNLGLLGYFKYFNFLTDNINGIFGTDIAVKKIALPIGISFFTFQIMSYVIDLYRREIAVQKNICDLSLYIFFFPQLIAGPIVKYRDIASEMRNRTVTLDSFVYGTRRFVYGLAKKVLIANAMALAADSIFDTNAADISTLQAWVGSIAYTMQIYYDFSGYSDMAIGLGRMFGFTFSENFNLPYVSGSITEFWRRWHISLSTWFREYVYIPLGGNRKGKIRIYKSLDSFYSHRHMARRVMDIRRMGTVSRLFHLYRTAGTEKEARQTPRAQPYLYASCRQFRLGAVPCGGLRSGSHPHKKHVCPHGRLVGGKHIRRRFGQVHSSARYSSSVLMHCAEAVCPSCRQRTRKTRRSHLRADCNCRFVGAVHFVPCLQYL